MLGMLLTIMPFSGMRVICIDSPMNVESVSTVHTEGDADCERLCPLHQPSSTATKEEGSDCALSADASSLSLFASIAVLRHQEPLPVPLVTATTYSDSPRIYSEPKLAQLGPPPKPQAL